MNGALGKPSALYNLESFEHRQQVGITGGENQRRMEQLLLGTGFK